MIIHETSELNVDTDNPARIHVIESYCTKGEVVINVEDVGESSGSTIILTNAQARNLMNDLRKFLDKDFASEDS